MRAAFTSDLHVDHHPAVVDLLRARLEALAPDVLVVAGDVSSHLEVLERTLCALRPAAGRRALFVPGNHDLWVGRAAGPSSRDRYEQELGERALRAGFEYLPAGPVVDGGVAFVGQTGWFDYSLRNPHRDAEIPLEAYRRKRFGPLRWNDGVQIRWPDAAGRPMDDEDLCAWMVARLKADLEAVAGRPKVVVTHHLPFRELVLVRGRMPWDFLNGFMGSAALGRLLRASGNVRRVVCGHTHARRRAVLAGADGPLVAETSPIGYPREYGGNLAERVHHRLSTFMV